MHMSHLGSDIRPAIITECERLKILVIEPRKIFKECLSYHLCHFPGIETICIESPEDWPKLAPDHPTLLDIILLCVAEGERLPTSLSEVAAAAEELRSLPVVVLSNERHPCQMMDLLKAGVRAFIPTSTSFAVAVQVLRLVGAGGTSVPSSCLTRLPDQIATGVERDELFTGRQKQVIEGIRLGKPNKIIAYELNMCESTVKVHVRTIMKKLNARNRTEVAYLYSSTIGIAAHFDGGSDVQRPSIMADRH